MGRHFILYRHLKRFGLFGIKMKIALCLLFLTVALSTTDGAPRPQSFGAFNFAGVGFNRETGKGLATAKVGIGAAKAGIGLLTGDRNLQQKGAGLIVKGAAVGAASHFLPSNNGGTTNTFGQLFG